MDVYSSVKVGLFLDREPHVLISGNRWVLCISCLVGYSILQIRDRWFSIRLCSCVEATSLLSCSCVGV